MLCAAEPQTELANVVQDYSGVKREGDLERKIKIFSPVPRPAEPLQQTSDSAVYQPSTTYCDDPYCHLKDPAGRVQTAQDVSNPPASSESDAACDIRAWKCDVCCKQFSQKHHLQTHLLCHSGLKRYECHVCHKSFKQQAHLNTHLLIHEGRRPHRCPHCDHSFLQVTHLKRHMVTHGGSGCLPCSLCGRRFAFPSDLAAHVTKHHHGQGSNGSTPGPTSGHHLQCEVCERLFQYPSQLRDHMLVHTQVRRFACQSCGMRFMKEHHLRNHQATHSAVKPFSCPVCGRAFSLKANMERHLLIHETERRFACERCGKRFSQPQTLKMHLVSHADIKPYTCSVCGKGLARAHNLRAHMAIHQHSKPHRCPDCTSTFTLRGNLVRHLKEKHGVIVPRSGEDFPQSTEPPSTSANPVSDNESQRAAAKRRKNPPKRLKKFGGSDDSLSDKYEDEKYQDLSTAGPKYEELHSIQQTDDSSHDRSPPHQPPYSCSPNSDHTSSVPQSSDGNCLEVSLEQQQHSPQQQHPIEPFPSYYHHLHAITDPAPTDHKPFPFHALQPTPGHHPMFGAPVAPNCFYTDQTLLPLPAPTAVVGPEEVGVRLQALHAAIDDLAGKVGPDHEKVSALHAALDELVSQTESRATQNL
ncbi:zinc finger protein 436-like [Ornithodoros turicata]|uniref:zinc finger protein 436-like n=1 Tax=Ornithodoros turicata TaxID=34597 RepID=UPI00313A1DCA